MSWTSFFNQISSAFTNLYTTIETGIQTTFGGSSGSGGTATPSSASTPAGRAGDIQVRPEELIKSAEACYQIGRSIDGLLEQVHSIMTEFFNSDVFEGQQAANVRDNYNRTRENLDKFPQMVAWLGGKLEQTAYAFTEADKDNVTLYTESVFAATILPMLPPDMQEGFFNKLSNDPAFLDQVLKQLEKSETSAPGSGKSAEEQARQIAAAAKAIKGLKTLYDVNKGSNVVIGSGGLVTASGQAASKFAKGMAAAGAVVTVGVSLYDAFTGSDQSPEMIAAQISSGLVQAAMGFTGVGAVVLATDALIQFVGPAVAGVMRDNADWLAGGGINAQDIINSANKFDQAIKDISLDARLDGTFKAIYSGDVLGVINQGSTLANGLVDFADSGINLAGYAAGGLIDKLIPGAGGPVAGAVIIAAQMGTAMVTMPLRAFNFAADLFTGQAQLGDLFSGPGNFIGDTLDMMGLHGAGEWVRDISGTIGSAVNSAVDAAVKFAEDAWNAAQQAIKDAAEAAARAAEEAARAVANAATTAGNAIADAANTVVNAVANAC